MTLPFMKHLAWTPSYVGQASSQRELEINNNHVLAYRAPPLGKDVFYSIVAREECYAVENMLDENFDKLVKQTLDFWNTPGCSVGIVDGQHTNTKVFQLFHVVFIMRLR